MRFNNEHYKLGERVRIKNIPKGDGDEDLNGRTGRLARRFHEINFGHIGIEIDRVPGGSQIQEKANLQIGEFEKIGEKK